MNKSIQNMKKGQKVRLLMDWNRYDDPSSATFGTKGDLFTVAYDQVGGYGITLINPNNNKKFNWSLIHKPAWERYTEKEFTDAEYEALLV